MRVQVDGNGSAISGLIGNLTHAGYHVTAVAPLVLWTLLLAPATTCAQVDTHVGAFNTGTGTDNIVVTGVGFTPKAILFYWSGRTETTDAVGGGTHYRGAGIVTSTTVRRAVSGFVEDGTADSSAGGISITDGCLVSLSTAGAEDGVADLGSFDADGFTLTVSDAFPRDQRIHFWALGGDDITNATIVTITEPAITGEAAYTGVGFQGDVVIFMSGGGFDLDPPPSNLSSLQWGAAVTSTSQWVVTGMSDDGQASSQGFSYASNSHCVARHFQNNNLNAAGSFVSFGTDGFTLNWSVRSNTGREWFALVIAGGDWAVGDLLTPTTTTTVAVSGLASKPAGAFFASHAKAESTGNTPQADDEWSTGAFSATDARGTQAITDDQAAATMVVGLAVSHDQVYLALSQDDTTAIVAEMDIQSIDSDGFTLVMDTADGIAAFVGYVAAGPAAAGGGAPAPSAELPRGLTILGVR